jgi:hypothetical protein
MDTTFATFAGIAVGAMGFRMITRNPSTSRYDREVDVDVEEIMIPEREPFEPRTKKIDSSSSSLSKSAPTRIPVYTPSSSTTSTSSSSGYETTVPTLPPPPFSRGSMNAPTSQGLEAPPLAPPSSSSSGLDFSTDGGGRGGGGRGRSYQQSPVVPAPAGRRYEGAGGWVSEHHMSAHDRRHPWTLDEESEITLEDAE